MTSDDVQRFKPVGADGPEVVLASDFDAMRQRAEKAEALLQELRMQHGPHDQTQKSGG